MRLSARSSSGIAVPGREQILRSGPASTTAAGLGRRLTPAQWQAVEAGLAVVTGRMLSLLPAARAAALAGGPVTIDLDTTDVEVYGRKKRGVAYNHQGQRVGRPHVATWAGRVALRADAGYFAGQMARAAHEARSACAAVCVAVIAAVMASRDVMAWHGHRPPVTSGRGGPGRLVRRCR